jgi:hypothetical protein
MIIVGYPCIGKSTYANSHGYGVGYSVIDLESSNFIKDGSWIESYCNVAVDLSKHGYDVFVSSHDAVRKQLLKSGYEFIFAIYPSLEIKDEWIERLHSRYLNTKLEKDYRAWQRAVSYYDEDVTAFKEDAKHFHEFYEIGHESEDESYDIASVLDEFKYGC